MRLRRPSDSSGETVRIQLMRGILKLSAQQIAGAVEHPVPEGAAAPGFALELDAVFRVFFEGILELGGDPLVDDPDSRLLVDVEGAVVQVRAPDMGPEAVDDHDLLVNQRLLVLVEADPLG